MAEQLSVSHSDTEWLIMKLALPAAVDFGDLMTTILERWPAAEHNVRWIDLVNDAERARPSPAQYRDAGRREMTLQSPSIGQLQVLRYDQDRPGEKTKQAFYLPACLVVNLRQHLADAELQDVAAAQRSAYQLLTLLNDQFGLEAGYLRRQDALNLCPSPPLAPADVLAQVVRNEAVAAHHEPALYWAAWDERVELDGDRSLVNRAIDSASGADFQQSVFDRQWALARQVRTPTQTNYGALLQSLANSIPADYLALLDDSEGTLSGFHYRAEDQLLDITAWAEPGTFVTPQEVAQLLSWRLNQRYDDGSAVQTVRVTFPNVEQAQAQWPVLRDIGCEVYYLDPSSGQPSPLATS